MQMRLLIGMMLVSAMVGCSADSKELEKAYLAEVKTLALLEKERLTLLRDEAVPVKKMLDLEVIPGKEAVNAECKKEMEKVWAELEELKAEVQKGRRRVAANLVEIQERLSEGEAYLRELRTILDTTYAADSDIEVLKVLVEKQQEKTEAAKKAWQDSLK